MEPTIAWIVDLDRYTNSPHKLVVSVPASATTGTVYECVMAECLRCGYREDEIYGVRQAYLTPDLKTSFVRDDGGRQAAGYKGDTGDCVVRSIAIATGLPYQDVYDAINLLGKAEHTGKRKRSKSSARTGVYKQTIRKYMASLGWTWTPTMGIGTGCTVHLKADELPTGRLVVILSKHCTAVIDSVIHDTYNPDRDGTRCVYGYYKKG